ncbi:MAG: murein biosynthesis integral membrane protein MurJ [Candidatus Gastranaerophilales bacterium]|nr:murein biosynthesis integral membrane protein MurJ [Candidatus Gastranaerophilales bacterium]
MTDTKQQSLLRVAWIIAFVTIISKFMGFLRDIVTANFYGAGTTSDAYFYAYQIPALALILLGGVGGPFHSATVAVFAKLIPGNEETISKKVNKLYSTFMTSSFLIFAVLTAFVFIFAEPIMGFMISGGSPELIHLAGIHLRIMSPILLIGGVIGIYYGLLVTFKEFLLPNLSPIVMSIVIIIAISLAKTDSNGLILAGATTVGAFCQYLVQFPKIKKLGFQWKPNLEIRNNVEFKNVMELLFPAILSSTVGQIYVYVDMFFASQLPSGAWSAIGYANRIFQFPVGILVTAFLVPLFPIFSKLAGEKNYEDIRYYFNKGVGLLNFVSFPILIAIILLSSDAVQLVFQRGAFDAKATAMVAQALIFLSIAIVPYVFRDSVTRIYYSFNDSKTPFIVAFSSIILKYVLNYFFTKPLGIGGITLSTSLVTLFNATILGILLTKKMDMGYKIYFKNILKMIIASIFTFAMSFIVYKLWVIDPSNWLLLAIKTGIMVIVCFGFYLLFAALLKLSYVKELLGRLHGYIQKH